MPLETMNLVMIVPSLCMISFLRSPMRNHQSVTGVLTLASDHMSLHTRNANLNGLKHTISNGCRACEV